MDRKRSLVLGIVAAFVVIGGIIIAVLLHQIRVTYINGRMSNHVSPNWNSFDHYAGIVWLFGLVFAVPGGIGFIAAFIQKKWMYVITCIFTMISLILTGIFFFIAGLTLVIVFIQLGTTSERCVDTGDSCKCRSYGETFKSYDSDDDDNPFRTCAQLQTFVTIFISILVFFILSWIAMLTEFVIACYFSCRSKTTPGVIITAAQQPMIPPGYEMVPPGYDMGYPHPSKV